MKLTEKEALGQYLMRKHQQLENDLTSRRDVVRWRDADEVDCMELMISRVRLLAFKEFMSDVCSLLKLFKD